METEKGAPGEIFDAPFAATRFRDWELAELIKFRDAHHEANPNERLLFVLDDHSQASYTSSHVQMSRGLADFDEAILSSVELAAYNETYRLSPERHVEVIRKNLMPLVAELKFDQTWPRLLPIDAQEIELLEANRNPVLSFTPNPLCLHVPVSEPTQALIGAPNGYFGGDLTPAQNYVLAEHMRTEHGYELLGLGSFLIAFVRGEPASITEATAAIDSVGWLYSGWNETATRQMTDAIAGSRVLVLSYRGS